MTVTKPRTRRFTACHRHPSEPVTGFCALCLRDRLSGLDSSSGQKTVVCTRRSKNHGFAPVPAPLPELRRSKSVVGEKCDLVADLRRKSCDVRARNSLSDLFEKNDEIGEIRVDLTNLGFPEPVIEINEDQFEESDEIRVSDDVIEEEEEEEGDMKTMKEYIDIEIEMQKNRRNIWEAASVFSHKLRKWRVKQKEKNKCRNTRSEVGLGEYGYGRRSCDTEPRFSIDAHRLSVEDPRFSIDAHRLSVEDPRFSFDEHRASWDGYMIARTIPRLTPMMSLVDNKMVNGNVNLNTIENLQMHSISEDGASSGGSGQSNSEGSSWSSIKSSSTKTVGLGGDDVKCASNARVSPANDVIFQGTKLVITEKELKDWHLNSVKNCNIESVANAPVSSGGTTVLNAPNWRKNVLSSRWKKVCNLWGHKYKPDDKKNVVNIPGNGTERGNSNVNLVRIPSSVSSSVNSRIKRDEFVLDRNRSTRYSTSDIDSGLLRLYLTPFRNTRRGKSGKNRHPLMPTNGLQLSQK